MSRYIATFYSHFGAMSFKKACEQMGYVAKLMPVPRNLSSSCGTCVRFEAADFQVDEEIFQRAEEIEQIVAVHDDEYVQIYVSE